MRGPGPDDFAKSLGWLETPGLRPECERFYDLASALDEALDYRRQGSVPQRQDHHWPRPRRQFQRQHPQCESTGVEAQDRMRERCNKLTSRNQIGAKMNGQGLHAYLRHVKAARAERFLYNLVIPSVGGA
jgi:hypothetical protein